MANVIKDFSNIDDSKEKKDSDQKSQTPKSATVNKIESPEKPKLTDGDKPVNPINTEIKDEIKKSIIPIEKTPPTKPILFEEQKKDPFEAKKSDNEKADSAPQNKIEPVKLEIGGKLDTPKPETKKDESNQPTPPEQKIIPMVLTEEQLAEFKEAFSLFDKDKDNLISVTDIELVMKSLGYSTTEMERQEMINDMDSDGDSKIDLVEFIAAMYRKLREDDTEEELKKCFEEFDTDKKGTITPEKMKAAFERIGETVTTEEIKDMISHADYDDNGYIVYEEFVRTMLGK